MTKSLEQLIKECGNYFERLERITEGRVQLGKKIITAPYFTCIVLNGEDEDVCASFGKTPTQAVKNLLKVKNKHEGIEE